jgi:hypothetical protein
MPSKVARRPYRCVGHPPISEPSTVPYSADPIAMPCSQGLRFQSDWMVCSAPEITTVSNPNKKPASADVTDQIMSCDRMSIVPGLLANVVDGF